MNRTVVSGIAAFALIIGAGLAMNDTTAEAGRCGGGLFSRLHAKQCCGVTGHHGGLFRHGCGGGLLARLKAKHASNCCAPEPACCEPAPCAPACEPEPCCEPTPCCGRSHGCGLFGGHRRGCGSSCGGCATSSCGGCGSSGCGGVTMEAAPMEAAPVEAAPESSSDAAPPAPAPDDATDA